MIKQHLATAKNTGSLETHGALGGAKMGSSSYALIKVIARRWVLVSSIRLQPGRFMKFDLY